MDLNVIGNFIAQYGFPFVACAAMFWQYDKQDSRHREEADKWAEVLASNTAAITELKGAISGLRKEVEIHNGD